MSEIIKCKALSPCPGLFSVLRNQRASGPETAAISRSATVRFIIRYVLRLRSWRVLAKIMRVKALIINIRRNSVSHTANQMFFVSLVDIVEFNMLQNVVVLFSCFLNRIWSNKETELGMKRIKTILTTTATQRQQKSKDSKVSTLSKRRICWYWIVFCERVKAPDQLKMIILQQMRFPTKQCRNGYTCC